MIRPAARFWFVAAVVVAAAVAVSFGVGRADEEEEAAPKKAVKKVVVPEDDTPSGGANVLPDVARAAATAAHPVLKRYFVTLSVACDRINTAGKSFRVLPLPLVWAKERDKYPADGFGFAALNEQNRPGETQTLLPKDVLGIQHYEPLVLAETALLLQGEGPDYPPKADRLAAAERALTAALFFHESAFESRVRRGPHWEPFKTEIVDKLTDVRLGLVKQSVEAKQWAKLREQVALFGKRYRANPKVLQELFAARLHEAIDLTKSGKLADLEAARDILSEFESQFPNTGNEQAKQVRAALASEAKRYLEEANSLSKSNQTTEARNILKNAASLDPDAPGLRERQRELKAGYSTLVVAVKRLPRLMSPATAREDGERMAVELLFDGLLEPTPDPAFGTTYRPELADGKPRVGTLAREVTLVGNAEWGRPGLGVFDAADLVDTVRLMREKRGLPSAEAADWLHAPSLDPADPRRVRLKLTQAHPDPRELLSFKLLPGKYLAGKNKAIDDDEFARRPFGTGPYKLAPGFQPADGIDPAPEFRVVAGEKLPNVVFVPNGNYWRRPGKLGQPGIKEIRFHHLAAIADPVNEFRGDRLHLVTDVPTRDLDRYGTVERLTVVTPATNRRVQMLAINHASPPLQSVDVRRGLSLAIDREAILTDVFRAGKPEFHKPLTGPFPVGCWQEQQRLTGGTAPLFDPDLATNKLRGVPDTGLPLSLLYPNDDPQAKEACGKIKEQIEKCGRVDISLEAVSPAELWTRVRQETRYDLAYVPFDYPDVFYSHALAALLDPTAAGRGGRNFLNYLVKGTNPAKADDAVSRLLTAVKRHCDYQGELEPLSRELAARFNDAVPFVPLWQLDRHIACSKNLKVFLDQEAEPSSPKLLDPARVFHNAGRWRMDDGR